MLHFELESDTAIITLKFLHFNLQIVSKSLSEPIRSHKDLDKDSAPHYHKAVKFYEALSKQLVHQGHVLDVFACALDQVLTICRLHVRNLLLE